MFRVSSDIFQSTVWVRIIVVNGVTPGGIKIGFFLVGTLIPPGTNLIYSFGADLNWKLMGVVSIANSIVILNLSVYRYGFSWLGSRLPIEPKRILGQSMEIATGSGIKRSNLFSRSDVEIAVIENAALT